MICFVVIEEESHPDLIRDENDLIYNLLLSVPTAALGGTVEIPTIDSKVKVKIEPGTQPGKVLRLRGKGLPNVNSYGYSNGTGDLLVNVSVYIPETLNKDEKQALEKMQESDNFKPNTSIKEKNIQEVQKTSSINFYTTKCHRKNTRFYICRAFFCDTLR